MESVIQTQCFGKPTICAHGTLYTVQCLLYHFNPCSVDEDYHP